MNINKKPSFFKGIKKITDPALKERVEQAILSVEKSRDIRDIPELKKMQGYKIHYRIRVGDYRIGVKIENDFVTFEAFGHRKDIYKLCLGNFVTIP